MIWSQYFWQHKDLSRNDKGLELSLDSHQYLCVSIILPHIYLFHVGLKETSRTLWLEKFFGLKSVWSWLKTRYWKFRTCCHQSRVSITQNIGKLCGDNMENAETLRLNKNGKWVRWQIKCTNWVTYRGDWGRCRRNSIRISPRLYGRRKLKHKTKRLKIFCKFRTCHYQSRVSITQNIGKLCGNNMENVGGSIFHQK